MTQVVETRYGRIKGLVEEGIHVFRGIPYAAAPAGELATAMQDAWIAFARTDDPNHSGIPEWPRYEPKLRANMEFSVPCATVCDPYSATRRVLDGVPCDRLPSIAGDDPLQ